MIRFGSRMDIWLPEGVKSGSARAARGGGHERPGALEMSDIRTARTRVSRRAASKSQSAPRHLPFAQLHDRGEHALRLLRRDVHAQGRQLADLDNAAKAIGLAIVFDSFDGFVARATGTSSEFGKQFDSLADMVSFGIAPAVLAFTWGVHGISETEFLDIRRIHEIGWWVALIS